MVLLTFQARTKSSRDLNSKTQLVYWPQEVRREPGTWGGREEQEGIKQEAGEQERRKAGQQNANVEVTELLHIDV